MLIYVDKTECNTQTLTEGMTLVNKYSVIFEESYQILYKVLHST